MFPFIINKIFRLLVLPEFFLNQILSCVCMLLFYRISYTTQLPINLLVILLMVLQCNLKNLTFRNMINSKIWRTLKKHFQFTDESKTANFLEIKDFKIESGRLVGNKITDVVLNRISDTATQKNEDKDPVKEKVSLEKSII